MSQKSVRSDEVPWLYYGPEWRDLVLAAEWLGEHAAPGEIVATEAAHYVHLHSGKKVVLPPMVDDASEAQRLLDEIPVRYLLVGELESPGFERRYMKPVVAAGENLWRPVFEGQRSDTVLYERIPDDQGTRGIE